MEKNILLNAIFSNMLFDRVNVGGKVNLVQVATLSLEEIDLMHRALNKKLKEIEGESLFENKQTKEATEIQNKIKILKLIFVEKETRINRNKNEALLKQKRRELAQIEAENKTPEDLRKEIEELEKNI